MAGKHAFVELVVIVFHALTGATDQRSDLASVRGEDVVEDVNVVW
jgi:hypothetical protein